MARRPRTGTTTPRVWFIRAGIGAAIGLLLGFGTGAAVVRVMQPPGVVEDRTEDAGQSRPSVSADAPEDVAADNGDAVDPDNGTRVPRIIGLEEGDARNAITRAGFNIGTVMFKSSAEPIGTVVAAFPVPGEVVVLPATVNLILSDGKPRADSLAVPPPREGTNSGTPFGS